jgi:hypothetical protein
VLQVFRVERGAMVFDRGCDDEAIPIGVLRLLLNGQGLVDGACLNRYGVKGIDELFD